MEWAKHGIRVNSVSPGLVKTAMTYYVETSPDWETKMAYYGGMPRLALPQELGGAYVYLLSDTASYTTGIDIPIAGIVGAWWSFRTDTPCLTSGNGGCTYMASATDPLRMCVCSGLWIWWSNYGRLPLILAYTSTDLYLHFIRAMTFSRPSPMSWVKGRWLGNATWSERLPSTNLLTLTLEMPPTRLLAHSLTSLRNTNLSQ